MFVLSVIITDLFNNIKPTCDITVNNAPVKAEIVKSRTHVKRISLCGVFFTPFRKCFVFPFHT